MKNPFTDEVKIFGGKFIIITEDNEFRMSHWVKGFGIMDSATRNWVLELECSFNLEKFEETNNTLQVFFQVYGERYGQFEVDINPFEETFSYNNQVLSLKEFSKTFKSLAKNP